MSNLERALNKHFSRFFERDRMDYMNYYNSHPVDVVEYDDRYEIVTDTPGYNQDEITVEHTDNYITIKGTKTKDNVYKTQSGKVHRNERTMANFSRSMKVPSDVVVDEINAKLENGVLMVTLPRNTNFSKSGVRSIPVS